MTIKSLLESGARHLQTSSKTPLLDAQYLLAHVLEKSVVYLSTWPDETVDESVCENFYQLIERRRNHWPVAYLLGTQSFWSLELSVNETTLIPRPETEHLVELALERMNRVDNYQVADLGTGSGAIGLAIAKERPNCQVFATDISEFALAMAIDNARQLRIQNIQFSQGDWYEALPPNRRYNVIVSNPPYVGSQEEGFLSPEVFFEPVVALFSQKNGLQDICRIVQQAPNYLDKNGWLLIEHGFLQAESVRCFFKEEGFQNVFTHKDYAKCERVTGGQL